MEKKGSYINVSLATSGEMKIEKQEDKMDEWKEIGREIYKIAFFEKEKKIL